MEQMLATHIFVSEKNSHLLNRETLSGKKRNSNGAEEEDAVFRQNKQRTIQGTDNPISAFSFADLGIFLGRSVSTLSEHVKCFLFSIYI